MSEKLILYSYYRSSCSWRVRIALEHKKLAYEYRAVNLLKGEQLNDEFEKINPLKFVPTLQIKTNNTEHTIYESMAILEYLEEAYSEHSLLPSDIFLRAKIRAFCDSIVSGIQPLQNLTVLRRVSALGGTPNEFAKDVITEKFSNIEKILQSTSASGKYCFDEKLTLADVCLVPQVYNALRFEVDMSKFPFIMKINEHLMKIDCFIKSHPSNQIDSA